MVKPRIYLCVYPSGFRRWRVKPDKPGPWKRPYRGLLGREWGQAYQFCSYLNSNNVGV